MKKFDIKLKKQKELFIEQLTKIPIIQLVCEKLDIGRTTFYRWKKSDKKFSEQCDKALEDGCALINDLAVSTLIGAMKNNNLTAVMYWLNHRSPAFSNKLELSGSVTTKNEKLTPEQETDIKRALKLMMMTGPSSNRKEGQNAKKKNK